MDEDEAWVQLYIKGEDKSGGPFPIEFKRLPKKRRICDLAELVYGKMVQVLPHCGAPHLVVYSPGTEFPSDEEEKLRPGMPVPQGTTDEKPLRVVAPASARAQQDIDSIRKKCFGDNDENIWKSVLRIRSDPDDVRATALVYDVHHNGEGQSFLYLLVNWHYELTQGNTYHIEQSCHDGSFQRVDLFTCNQFKNKFFESKEFDVVIYKLQLDDTEWDVGPGIATRILAASESKRPRREKSQAPRFAEVICKTPVFGYDGVKLSTHVRVYAFPHAVLGRWVANASVSAVDRLCFYLQALSAPGASGGAVVTTHSGVVIGILGGGFDSDSKNTQFMSYACSVSAVPKRPSSLPTSPASS